MDIYTVPIYEVSPMARKKATHSPRGSKMVSSTGLCAVHDTGPPEGSPDYTTLVTVHGYAWHSGATSPRSLESDDAYAVLHLCNPSEIFTRMFPHAQAQNARIVTVNRRDYPGTTPYPPEELALLQPAAPGAAKSEFDMSLEFARRRGQELLEFLVELIRERGIPEMLPGKKRSGIVVMGWSLGTVWMSALLGCLESPNNGNFGIDLSKYLRRVVLYGSSAHHITNSRSSALTHRTINIDGPSFLFGFPPPVDDHEPILRPGQLEENPEAVSERLGGYFSHGDTLDTLARGAPDREPAPTLRTMTAEERARTVYQAPGYVDGSDQLLIMAGHRARMFAKLWEDAVALPEDACKLQKEVEVRWVWCDRSIWKAIHAAWWVEAQVAEARAKGRRMKNVTTVRIRGANHFVSRRCTDGRWEGLGLLTIGPDRRTGTTQLKHCTRFWMMGWRRLVATFSPLSCRSHSAAASMLHV